MSVFVLFSLSACSDFKEGKPLADNAVIDFHSKFNAGEFTAIYETAHPDLKSVSSMEDFLGLLEAINRKLGPVAESNNTGWRVNSHNLKTYVSLVQETTFESGKGTESFVYRIQDDEAKLISYNINSNDLIMK